MNRPLAGCVFALGLWACASRDVVVIRTPRALDGAPVPWPARLEDLTWVEGRWAGRDASGACHIEHWLGARDGLLWRVQGGGADAMLVRVVIADVTAVGMRELVLDGRRYSRRGDTLRVDVVDPTLLAATRPEAPPLTLTRDDALRATCPPPSP